MAKTDIENYVGFPISIEAWTAMTDEQKTFLHARLMRQLLRDIISASDANDGGSLMNCIDDARELLAHSKQ